MTDPDRYLQAIARLHEPTDARGNRQGGFKRPVCKECGFPHPCRTRDLAEGKLS